jgi:hypothetical protein
MLQCRRQRFESLMWQSIFGFFPDRAGGFEWAGRERRWAASDGPQGESEWTSSSARVEWATLNEWAGRKKA